jgi:hypothetical protein
MERGLGLLKENKVMREIREVENIQECDQLLCESFLWYLEEFGEIPMEVYDKVT